ncbi:MAG: glycogen debranching protein GlgX [cyanobacterium endosymbiont of Rhopalodia sterrenbergii]
MNIKLLPGNPYPLGSSWDGKGTNFAIFSKNATRVDLCLFNHWGQETSISLQEVSNYIWHGYIPGIKSGQHYGFRVHGPFNPIEGYRFNPKKLLIDPYAKAITGDVEHKEALFSYPWDCEDQDLTASEIDDAPSVPKAVVIDESFPWEGDTLLQHPWHKTIIYEVHVKGFTKQHREIPENLRGTYAGLAHPNAIAYLQGLGITAVELLPVHHFFVQQGHLIDKGLTNYWGYDSLGYFAPHSGYSASGTQGQQVTEFKNMVKTLHKAGIEVILDVVYNHTGEGNHLGPTLFLRGIDNQIYYRINEENSRYYVDFTGCGNSLNVSHPDVLKLIMDSLRYWVLEMHIDGFRFDLAAALARELYEVGTLATFFDIIHQDPVLSNIKLIAEPWDLGKGGYQVGQFPLLWSEWNGQYRDEIRNLWCGQDSTLASFAYRFMGSSDLYKITGRKPRASINFITSHDGFTLADLVSYNEKHNEVNGENNNDGETYNHSWNCGEEGETNDPQILALREQQKRNFLTTLMLSQGVPMILGGDEIGRSQKGNNNAYCQDNDISWFNWDLTKVNQDFLLFTQQLIKFRHQHPVFRRRKWFQGKELYVSDVRDVVWFNPKGEGMTEEQWEDGEVKAISIFLNGEGIETPDIRGNRIIDASFLLLFNSEENILEFTLPSDLKSQSWKVVIDTTKIHWIEQGKVYQENQLSISVEGRSLMVLQSI